MLYSPSFFALYFFLSLTSSFDFFIHRWLLRGLSPDHHSHLVHLKTRRKVRPSVPPRAKYRIFRCIRDHFLLRILTWELVFLTPECIIVRYAGFVSSVVEGLLVDSSKPFIVCVMQCCKRSYFAHAFKFKNSIGYSYATQKRIIHPPRKIFSKIFS